MLLEKDLMKKVNQRLEIYKLTKQIIWFTRLNSGKIKTYFGSYIKMCDKNTPDFIIIYEDKNKYLNILFLECKSYKGKLSKGQLEFKNKYTRKWIYVLTIYDIKELDYFIDNNSIEITKEMQEFIT